jgi:hypothetical protein
MSTAIYRTEDPALETIEFGTVYHVHDSRTGASWVLYESDDCGVSSIEPLDVPDGWDDAYEYATVDTRIWSRIADLASDAFLASADLEVTIVPVLEEGADPRSRALLYRFVWLF